MDYHHEKINKRPRRGNSICPRFKNAEGIYSVTQKCPVCHRHFNNNGKHPLRRASFAAVWLTIMTSRYCCQCCIQVTCSRIANDIAASLYMTCYETYKFITAEVFITRQVVKPKPVMVDNIDINLGNGPVRKLHHKTMPSSKKLKPSTPY